jgi:pSer/pThr/pTyr-binding forkhead associated (FHA) protein
MQVVLVMFRPEGDRRSFSITRDITVIGRREDCDFRIPLGDISRKHCRLVKDGESALRIEDLGSSNGTFRNGERVQEAELAPGDTVQIGSVVFVVQIDGTPADDDLQPIVAAGPARSRADEAPTVVGPHDSAQGNGEFDPMAVLGNNDSGVAEVPSESMVLDLQEEPDEANHNT